MPLATEDRLALMQIEAQFDWAIDVGDVEAWVNAWTEDGVFEATYATAHGRDELRAMLKKLETGFSAGKRHTTSNYVIEGDGNEARFSAYLIVFEREDAPRVVATGTFTDTFVKRDGIWKVRHRRLDVDRNGQKQD